MDAVFGPIVMSPPVAPSAGISAEGGAGDGLQGGVDQILRRGLDGIVIEEIQELGNGSEALLTREHTGTREVGGSTFANLPRRIVGQNGKKRINGFLGAQHGQSLDGPEARLLIRIARIAKERAQYGGRLNAAISDSAESPKREITAIGIVMNLIEKFCEALGLLHEVVSHVIDFHCRPSHARLL